MFLPDDFIIPQGYQTDEFIVRPLLISDVVKDYDAVMSSIEELQGIFGPRSSWPQRDLSFEQDLIDLGWHHKEFQIRNSFAYTVMNKEEIKCLGCVYLYPTDKAPYDAEAYCWTRTDERNKDELLFESFRIFLAKWPLKNIAFPGRSISWHEWNNLG